MRTAGPARWIAITCVAVLAAVVAVLAVVAYQRANPEASADSAAPVPTFELGVRTPSPTPTPTPPATAEASTFPMEQRRLLSIGSEQWWRSTAGRCDGPGPLIERSSDGGATWTDVTPGYLGVAEVQTLDAFSPADGEVVAAVVGCSTQALRSYTRGEFWESYPEVLAASRYIDVRDAATVHLPAGPVPAPCGNASGLRAAGDVVALLCDAKPWRWTGSWQELPVADAVALAIDGQDVIVAHKADDCAGTAVSRVARDGASARVGCAEGTDASSPVAIDPVGSAVVVWSGDQLSYVGR